ncbi:hypothetical protein FHS95_000701 [Sphingomonas naasensis]|uniref:L,D-TPase catalytic domain-containing protein n=1 Tax=Sphingomonas naasensis TaxID=1344951 RepID=A0A4S1WS63_9SPHN|nr:L,D-transpeptidase family protein [Sphingomonas naasensis]NIJ19032.1 hypothetical protein [Sphingomonas naasensis]TGX46234.1 hypothetical protein E5A74_03500 [Sphingomonas naasensis]
MVRGARVLVLLAAGMLVPMAPAAAQSPVDAAQPALPRLKPGQSVWFDTPQLIKTGTASAPVKIVIAIQQQLAMVYQGERLVGVSTVSTGAPGYETPLGEFTILEKKVFHRSNLYSNAPMPHMQRLTWGGVALHAGQLPGYPASHGCIRLPRDFARALYDLTAMGGRVVVVDDVVDAPLYLPVTPLLTADTRSFDPGGISYSAPVLTAETRDLGGAAYDVLTMRGDPPAEERPASWVTGGTQGAGQPPAGRGSR